QGYSVTPEGNILVRKLGLVKVMGMTTAEIKDKLQEDLLPYLKEPIVSVYYHNHQVIILGDAGNQQIVEFKEDKISLLEVLAKSNGIKDQGAKDKILIIRDSLSNKIFKRINLEDYSLFTSTSPWYYL